MNASLRAARLKAAVVISSRCPRMRCLQPQRLRDAQPLRFGRLHSGRCMSWVH